MFSSQMCTGWTVGLIWNGVKEYELHSETPPLLLLSWIRDESEVVIAAGRGRKPSLSGFWSLKMDRKDEYVCQVTSLWGRGGLDGCLHPCSEKSQLIELYFTSDWCESKGCGNMMWVTHQHIRAAGFLKDPPMWQERWRVLSSGVRVITVWWIRQMSLYSQLKLNHSKSYVNPGVNKHLERFRRDDVRLQKKIWASQGPQWELKPAFFSSIFPPSKLHLGQWGWKMEPLRQGLVYGIIYRPYERNSRRSSLQQTIMCSLVLQWHEQNHSRRPHVNSFSEHQI